MAKLKKVSYTLIPNDGTEPGVTMYAMLRSIVNRFHDDIRGARIALAWCTSWKSDVDGRLTLGKCKRASDLDRELHEFDFVVMLNAEWWQHADVKDNQREALLDHEVSHCAPKLDEVGEQMEDERGRKCWRMVKHDIEEFSGVVERHGLYKRDLEVFAVALRRRQGSLLEETELSPDQIAKHVGRLAADPKVIAAIERLRPKPGSGIDSVTISHGDQSVTLRADDQPAGRA